jgi:predicted amidophosphoribosyltransferase
MSYCVYRDGAVRATRLIKEARYEALARCIGDLLGEWLMAREAFSPIHYDCVIPIPQHWIRRWTHRYNQAEVLAEGIGRRIDRPIEPGWLQRTRWTPKQGLQTIEERRQNMVSVFGVRSEKAVRGKRVLLVDDVMTSGATLQDATRALKEAGAIGVSAVVFARGVSARGAAGSRVSGPSMAGGRAGGKSVDASGPGGHRGNGPTEMSPGGDPDRPEVGESLFKRRKIH